jgi:hypothetical protein
MNWEIRPEPASIISGLFHAVHVPFFLGVTEEIL